MKIYDVSRLPSSIALGWDGENNWRPIAFECSALLTGHPDGVVTLWLLPKGAAQAFPVALERDGNTVIWTPLNEEMTAEHGQLQVVVQDGTDVGKSKVVDYTVHDSLVGGADHPTETPSWAAQVVADVTEQADRAEEAADSISESIGEQLPGAIAEYLEEHPVTVTETDPTVPAWAKNPQKPSYTAAEVGALPDSYTPPVQSVNGKTGAVTLSASDVHALPDSTAIPTKTSDLQNDSGFLTQHQSLAAYRTASAQDTIDAAQNTAIAAKYTKPSGGIPASDIESGVIPDVSSKQNAPLEIHVTESGGTYSTTATAEQIRAAKENSVFVVDGKERIKALLWLPWDEGVGLLIGMQTLNSTIMSVAATVTTNNVLITVERTVIPTDTSDLTNGAGFITMNDVPAAVTEQTVSGWGFTKNTGTYSKPSGGIPKSDLASDVQTSLGKADTALQTAPVTSVNNKTGAVTLTASDVGALPDDTVLPAAVTEQTVAGWGFTKNTGTYSKPSGGIPASDLAAGVIPTVDSALSTTSTNPVQNKVVKAAFDERDGWMQKCALVSDTAGSNLWNPETKQVGLIAANGRVYTGGSYDNYRYNEITGISVGDTIDCYDFYNNRWVKKQIMRIAAFDANGTAIEAKGSKAILDTYTVPDGIVKIWVCLATTQTQIMALVNATETPTEYIEYGSVSQYYIATEEFLPVEDFVVNLPSDLYALVGYEMNVYFENLVEDWTKYDWNVNCDKGMQLERGYRITPTADDVGNYTLSIKISNGKDSATVSTTLHVIAASANSGVTKTVMVLGDSTTNNGIAVTKLNDNFTNDVMNITLVGTRGTAPNLHEGRSGWKFSSYFNPPNAGDIAAGVENPWYNPTTQTFDANYYFTNTGITKPDWLFINLGINDVFGYETDSALEAAITNCESLCDSMIASIKSASPSTKIGLCLTIPPNHSQDAFGKAYKCGQTRNRYKRNNLLWVHSLIETYSNRTSDEIYLVPIYTNLDTVYNMGLETLPVNARNTAVTYESPILNGGVHPVSSGYWQIADVYTAFLKSQS